MTEAERIAFMVAELRTIDACDDQCPGSDVCIGCPTKLMREAAATITQLQEALKFNAAETLGFITEMKDAIAHISKELRAVKAERDTL